MTYDKIKKHFRWKPSHTLEDGLRKTIEWYIEFLKNMTISHSYQKS